MDFHLFRQLEMCNIFQQVSNLIPNNEYTFKSTQVTILNDLNVNQII